MKLINGVLAACVGDGIEFLGIDKLKNSHTGCLKEGKRPSGEGKEA